MAGIAAKAKKAGLALLLGGLFSCAFDPGLPTSDLKLAATLLPRSVEHLFNSLEERPAASKNPTARDSLITEPTLFSFTEEGKEKVRVAVKPVSVCRLGVESGLLTTC